MAEIILAVLCIVVGAVFALLTLLGLWAGGLEQAATGSTNGRAAVIWFAIIALAGIGGGISILVF